MTYIPIKPDRGPSPKLDAPIIRQNFVSWASVFSNTSGGVVYNHAPMNDPNQGDHEAIILENQLNDPGVTQDLDALYNKNAISLASTQPQLFIQIPKFLPTKNDPTNAPNVGMQLTYNVVNTAGPQYQSFMAGGLLVYWGSTTNVAVPIVLSPSPTKILFVDVQSQQISFGFPYDAGVTILSNNSFQINSLKAVGVYKFTWMAIAAQ